MNFPPELDYRRTLKECFAARITKNPGYSMRAFARDLKLTPQMLSAVLGGKKDLSIDTAAEIAGRLGFDPRQAQDFLDATLLKSTRSEAARSLIRSRFEERHQQDGGARSLTMEMFQAISNWYHYAIMELVSCEGFKSDPKWIANRLGISVFEAREAVARLIELEILEEKNGQLQRTEFLVSALSDVPAAALREHARQLLTKGLTALEEQAQGERDITSMTMATDPALLPEAKKMIRQFRRKLCRFLESGKKTEVYVFTPALFRLTTKRGSKS